MSWSTWGWLSIPDVSVVVVDGREKDGMEGPSTSFDGAGGVVENPRRYCTPSISKPMTVAHGTVCVRTDVNVNIIFKTLEISANGSALFWYTVCCLPARSSLKHGRNPVYRSEIRFKRLLILNGRSIVSTQRLLWRWWESGDRTMRTEDRYEDAKFSPALKRSDSTSLCRS